MKITVVGAGNVGATVADNLVRRELAEEIEWSYYYSSKTVNVEKIGDSR